MPLLSPQFRIGLSAAALVFAAAAFTGAGPAAAQSGGKTVATVNGEAVTEADLVRLFRELPREVQAQGVQQLYPLLLEEVIGRRVVSTKAREEGVQDLPEIQERMRQAENELIYQYFLINEAEARVSDAEVQKAYDDWVAQQPGGEEIKTRHILVETEEEARDIIQKVTDGTPFADLAKEVSMDSGSAAKGGDLGWLARGETVEPFENAAFALQPNTFTGDPVQSQFGWHVILVDERREITPPSYEELAPRFRQQLAEQHVRAVIEEAIQGAQVERFDLDGNPLPAPQ
ncbi:peptidylprolyl isomerase [Pacificispira sp.]|uniref:peptidylprolyl isomerase n=1 Tax=Pacificispira sp. TaxID=2888761 RepID=UPI003BAC8A29